MILHEHWQLDLDDEFSSRIAAAQTTTAGWICGDPNARMAGLRRDAFALMLSILPTVIGSTSWPRFLHIPGTGRYLVLPLDVIN